MTAEEAPITSEDELNAELRSVLLRAYVNGIGVEGGWDCTNGPEHPDWDVIVTEVRKDEDPESTSPS
ncbi:MAG: hypothetical protein V5A62_11530 [Haloarculaceae archaeon]